MGIKLQSNSLVIFSVYDNRSKIDKILKENSNYERLNLDSDFEICDDTQRTRIIKSISGKNKKAKELGVPIIDEEAFLRMIGEDSGDNV